MTIKRDVSALANNEYDVVIIGGGIYGACLAWEAALRSLSVALVEKGDFCSGTSANSLKTIHGGLRYLQNADFKRLHVSSRERTAMLRIAPHLVHILPVIVPTYGFGKRSKLAMGMALRVNDSLTHDRMHLSDPGKRVPNGAILSKQECLERLPGIDERGLTGCAVFYDAQVYNSERLALSFLLSAAKAGADVANYAEAIRLIENDHSVTGVRVRDCLTGAEFDVRAKMVLNASGPWLRQEVDRVGLAKAINIVTRPIFERYAVGFSTRKEAGRPGRLYFVSPWRKHSIIGTAYSPYEGNPNQFRVSASDVQSLLDDFNRAYPAADLKREDVTFAHGGLLPIAGVNAKTDEPRLTRHPRILDQRQHRQAGLITVEGVKYTTARHIAEKVIDRVFQIWNMTGPPSVSAITSLPGGEFECFSQFVDAETHRHSGKIKAETLRTLIHNYGTIYPKVLEHIEDWAGGVYLDDASVLEAEVLYSVRKEMAQKLSDVVFRRTELGSAERPPNDVLQQCADVMGAELGWDEGRKRQEIGEVLAVYDWATA